ncbi:GntR family transcriptional regulator [Paenibacillus sp. HB172176]|uniref:GntR family transcriptional regulator n=1 Tax=Paenibacillus sp. HB172176 TaxID=2493690 RepID=UPI00143AABEA|nr:GntR family transcriptional regulator [Paenibacillus sp. HB172176]
MLLQIDLESETPIYTQLVQCVIEGIAMKELRPGEALPSVRSLAEDLGINLHTVNKAYQLLKQEGYVLINRKQGAVIQPGAFPPADDSYKLRLRSQLRPLVADAICRGMTMEQFAEESRMMFAELLAKEEEEKHE